MPRSPLRVGLVGFGYAGATFHAPLIAATPGLVLASVASRDAPRVRAAWPRAEVEPTPQALFARADIDLVVIATPNDSHHPLAAQALAAGRHVVVDKPFALDVAQADDLIARATRAGRLLSVFHNRRWDADFLTLRALLAAGTLGRVVHLESHFDRFRPGVRARWREGDGPGAGLWYDLGPHLLDQALCLFGPPERLTLDRARQRDGAQADDWFHAVLAYGPLRVVLHAGALAAATGPRFIVHGTRGSFVKRGLDTQEDALKAGRAPTGGGAAADPDWGCDPNPGRLTLAQGEALVEQPHAGERGDYRRYYAGIRDAIRHGAPNPVPAEQALAVMRWLDRGRAGDGG